MNYPAPFGKYLLLERVNVGGMAEVFKAKAFGVEGFERILAIKRILPNMADDDEFINMFVDEARIAVQLSHANIVGIFELGKFENQYYIAMEYVAGKDVRQLLDRFRKRKQTMPIPAAAYLTSKICEGLDYAHRKCDPAGRPMNVIHRDVSPQNVLVSFEGAVKVTDFGIAKAEDRASKTQAGVLKGKFGYMSPEQVRGMEIDHRSDVFAVGILLYEMVTGSRLFIGESDFSTLEKVRNADVIPPREHNPDIPEELERIMLKALARERDERYAWASELHDDLQQFLIEGNTIFNGKRMAAVMHGEYQADIEAEMVKMEEFMRIQAPPNMVNGGSDSAQTSAPRVQQPSDELGGPVDNPGERTMIFESGFADMSEASTNVDQQAVAIAEPEPMGNARSVSRSKSKPAVSVVAASPMRGRSGGGSGSKHKSATPIIAGAVTVVVLLLVLLGMLLFGGATGTLVIMAQPAEGVDIFLDSKLVGSKTPLTLQGVAVGPHTLSARAKGYEEKSYRFELAEGAPAIVRIELASQRKAMLVVVSTPTGADVYFNGEKKGPTPQTLNVDASTSAELAVRKEGFTTVKQTVTFTDAEKSANAKTVQIKLEAVVADGQAGGKSEPTHLAVLEVDSTPSGATLYIDRKPVGKTPYKADNLDPSKSYALEVAKNGYRPFKNTVSFNGLPRLAVTAPLEPLPKPVVASGPPDGGGRKRPPKGGGCSGSDAKISVMTVGKSNCKVTVGSTAVGTAPFFKKPSPVGSCKITVTCADGKSYSEKKSIKADGDIKVIVKPEMWK